MRSPPLRSSWPSAATCSRSLQQTMAFFQADAANVLQEGLWRFVRIGTRFGDIWNPRLPAPVRRRFIAAGELALWPRGAAAATGGLPELAGNELVAGAHPGHAQRPEPRGRRTVLGLAGPAGGLAGTSSQSPIGSAGWRRWRWCCPSRWGRFPGKPAAKPRWPCCGNSRDAWRRWLPSSSRQASTAPPPSSPRRAISRERLMAKP